MVLHNERSHRTLNTGDSAMIIRILLALVSLLIPAVALHTGGTPTDEQAIRDVLCHHYVEGMYIKRDPDLLRAGLAETCVMQVYWNGELRRSTISEWFDRMKLSGTPTKKNIESQIKVLDVTGVAAVARVDLFVDSKHKYTDYFGL